MQLNEAMTQIKQIDWKKHKERLQELFQKKPLVAGGVVVVILLVVNLVGIGDDNDRRLVERSAAIDFQDGRILNDRESTFYYGKEKLLSAKTQAMFDGQTKLEVRLAELERQLAEAKSPTGNQTAAPASPDPGPAVGSPGSSASELPLELYGSPEGQGEAGGVPRKLRANVSTKGPDLIAFPVKAESKGSGLILPAGSYVKAKILTGVDVPEGKTYPVLMVLDFSYVAPNDHKIDLAGCFMIAKAQGDLSTERVQMQATKMSCVSKKGKMFEREVNGFVADDKDGSFAMKGKINSKQGRVASMAFMAGVVDGVGKAVQAAQTTQAMNPLGGSSSVLTGDAGKYAMAGGASNAAGMVAQWYLQQAQNLAPTVAVGSGRDVWIVMNDKVKLPEDFFKKEGDGNESIYSYFTRVLE